MPITFNRVSRRDFLRGTLAVGTTLVLAPAALAAAPRRDRHRFVLLSDTHIAADRAKSERGVTMAANMAAVIAEVSALVKAEAGPATVFLNGDCAHHTGEVNDYKLFLELITPLAETGVPIHLTIGNHDHRERLWKCVPHDKWSAAPRAEIAQRHALVVETPRADWVLLDSLDKLNETPGLLGEKQLAWLKQTLDARPDKNVIVMMHHHPQPSVLTEVPATATQPATQPAKMSGAVDSPALMEILQARKQVKALIFGHTHNWNHGVQDGLHLINLPAVAYIFRPSQVSGWVDCRLLEHGARLELRCVDPKHARQGDVKELKWR